MQVSSFFLDKFVAPELSKLGKPQPPDLAQLGSRWINQFILTSVFKTGVSEPTRTYLMQLFRRGEGAIDDYRAACAALQLFLTSPATAAFVISPYFQALRHFEMCLAQAYQAYLIFRKMNDNNDYFSAGDHSPLDRLRNLYNTGKHADERIEAGEIPTGGSAPIWLTSTGLASAKMSLTYEELAEILTELAGGCDEALDLIANADKYRAGSGDNGAT